MSTCDIAQLLKSACSNNFAPLDQKVFQAVMLQLLCEIKQNGTGAGGQDVFVGDYGGGGTAPTDIPTSGVGYAWDTNNNAEWIYYSGAWNQITFTSAELTLTGHNAYYVPHPWPGQIPRHVEVVLRCISAEGGYAAGQEMNCEYMAAGSGENAMVINRDTTNIGLTQNSPFGWQDGSYLFNVYDGTGSFTVTLSTNWRAVIRARL